MKRRNQCFWVILYCWLSTCCLQAEELDSINIYDAIAEQAFFEGDLIRSVEAYERAFEIYWQYRIPNNIVHQKEQIRLVERLAVTLRATGDCSLAVQCLKKCFHKKADKVVTAKVIHHLIQCDQQKIAIDSLFKEQMLLFFNLEKINTAAHHQLRDFLEGAKPDEEALSNFFVVLEKGFVPAVEALEKQEESQQQIMVMGVVSFSTILLACILGFILYILKKEKDHIQREKIALLKGKEKETDRLSIDLHDILGYKIVELKDQTNKLYDTIAATPIQVLAKGLDELHESMRYIVQANLTPESLKFGLAPALETLVNRVNALGVIQFKCYKHGLKTRLEASFEKHVFYIIQELVNNIIKHSKGQVATIEVTQNAKEISIIVEDDGIGYHPSVNTLKTVKARTGFLKGTVFEDSQEDHGSTVIITVPIKK